MYPPLKANGDNSDEGPNGTHSDVRRRVALQERESEELEAGQDEHRLLQRVDAMRLRSEEGILVGDVRKAQRERRSDELGQFGLHRNRRIRWHAKLRRVVDGRIGLRGGDGRILRAACARNASKRDRAGLLEKVEARAELERVAAQAAQGKGEDEQHAERPRVGARQSGKRGSDERVRKRLVDAGAGVQPGETAERREPRE